MSGAKDVRAVEGGPCRGPNQRRRCLAVMEPGLAGGSVLKLCKCDVRRVVENGDDKLIRQNGGAKVER